MKIGIYDPYLDTLGGGEKYMLTIAECLSIDHDVSVFWDNPEIHQTAGKRFNLHLQNVNFEKNIFSPGFNLIRKITESRNYDLIIFLSDGSLPLVFSKKFIVHFQFPIEWVNNDSALMSLKKSKISTIICNSLYTKKYIDRKLHVNSKVLYPPADLFTGILPKKEDNILTVGRFNRMSNGVDFKKHSVLIDIFKSIVDQGLKNWKLNIITHSLPQDEKYIDKLENKIGHYPVKILRAVSYTELWEMYAKSKIYWHAAGYDEDLDLYPERAEHFGIATVEAMSAGCVPVVIHAGGQTEIVKDGENGFLWGNPDQLRRKTLGLIKHENIWKNLSLSAMHHAKQFGKVTFCKEINKIINTI